MLRTALTARGLLSVRGILGPQVCIKRRVALLRVVARSQSIIARSLSFTTGITGFAIKTASDQIQILLRILGTSYATRMASLSGWVVLFHRS